MKGFIFAAGYGERLRPITDTIPKPLVPVMNVPAICFALTLLREAGITEVVCNLHYRPDDIMKFFEANRHFGMKVNFSYEPEILGTGGGLKKCEPLFGDGDFVIVNSDVIIDIDLRTLIDFHRSRSSPATLALRRHEHAARIAPVAADGDRILDFKNFLGSGIDSSLIYTGVAVLSPRIFRYLVPEFSSVVYTGYVDLIRNARVHYQEHRGDWFDIGNAASYRETNLALLRRGNGLAERMRNALSIEMRAVDECARIDPAADISGSVVGRNVSVGKGAVVRDSVLLPGSAVPAGSTVINAVVCGDTIIGA